MKNKPSPVETLLEKAKKVPVTASISHDYDTDEMMELAIAWAHDQIRAKQASVAIGRKSSGNYLYAMAIGLRRAVRKGILVKFGKGNRSEKYEDQTPYEIIGP